MMKNKLLLFAVILALLAGPALAAIPVPTGINPATSANWANGDQYRLAFITSTTTTAESADIAYYNTFVQDLADAADLGDAAWYVIGSTSLVDARDNTSTNPTLPDDDFGNGTGCPILLVDGTTVVAIDNADLWDGEIAHIIDQDENGDTITHWPWTGTYWDGTAAPGHPTSHGALGDSGEVGQGDSSVATDWVWRQWTSAPGTEGLQVYAMSEVLSYGYAPTYIYPPYGAVIEPNNVDFLWENLEMDPNDPNYTEDIYVEVLFGTDPNKTDGDMNSLTLNPVNGYKVTTVTKEILIDGIYFWQINSDIGEPNIIEGPLYWFEIKSDSPPDSVGIGPDMVTWSGMPVDLTAVVLGDDDQSPLDYVWTYDAPGGVTVDIDTAAGDDIPTVTVTKVPYMAPNVANGSFEDPVLADDDYVYEGNVPSWISMWGQLGVWHYHTERGGAQNPLASEFAYIPNGDNVAWVTIDASSDHCVYQETAVTIEAGKTYVASAMVGNISYNAGLTANHRIEIVGADPAAETSIIAAESATLAAASVSATSPIDPNDWILASVTYTAGASAVADPNVGQLLGIRLIGEPYLVDYEIHFDQVVLTVNGQDSGEVYDPSMSSVTINVAVNDQSNPEVVTDSMTIDVYETACDAARDGKGLDEEGDINKDCDVGLEDIAEIAQKWFNDTGLTAPVEK